MKTVLKEDVDAVGTVHPDFMINCPGCECLHGIWTTNVDGGPVWTFNGNMEKPTFSPSLKVTYPEKDKTNICHSFIRDGKIQFLNDCTHKMKGQTVELPEI
jgi:hypothetical protein